MLPPVGEPLGEALLTEGDTTPPVDVTPPVGEAAAGPDGDPPGDVDTNFNGAGLLVNGRAEDVIDTNAGELNEGDIEGDIEGDTELMVIVGLPVIVTLPNV